MNYAVKTTIPVESGVAHTATGNSNAFVLPNSEANVEVLINATAVTGTTPSLTPKLQVSNDGVTWFDAITGTAMTATGTQRLMTQSLCGYGRVAYTISGTTPSFTLTTTVLAN